MIKIKNLVFKMFMAATTVLIGSNVNSQSVGIGTTSPLATSILDITSTTQGMLLPRMDSSQRKAITSPARGLMVYQTDADLLYVHNNTAWGYLAPTRLQVLNNIGGTTTFDCSKALDATVTINADINLSITNAIPGMIGFIAVKQGVSGNAKLLLPAGSKVGQNGLGQLTLSTAPGATDIVAFYYNGTDWLWQVANNFTQ